MRTKITLECTECKNRNYSMTKDKKNILSGWKRKSIADFAVSTPCTKKQNNCYGAKQEDKRCQKHQKSVFSKK